MESVSKFRIFQNSFLFFSRRDDQQRKLDLIRNMIRNVIKTTLFKFPFLSFSMRKEFRNFEISNEFYYNHNIGILYKKKPGPVFVNPFQDSIGEWKWKFLNLPKWEFLNFSKRWRHYDTFDWHESRIIDRAETERILVRSESEPSNFSWRGEEGEVSGGRDERAALVALEFCIIEGAGSLAFKRNVSKMETF